MSKYNREIQQLIELNGKLERIVQEINKSKNALSAAQYNTYCDSVIKAIVHLESTTITARNGVNQSFKSLSMPFEANKLNEKIISDAHKISIKNDASGLTITLPATLPHYKTSYKSLLEEPLNIALKNYQKSGNKLPEFSKAVIVVINHVKDCGCEASVRDNDNYDYKQIVNVIAYWTLPDDSYKCCNMFNATKIGTQDFTEVKVMDPAHFSEWVSANCDSIFD